MGIDDMREHPGPEQGEQPFVVIGEVLPGILLASDLPEGVKFWDQSPVTNLGQLLYSPVQRRSGGITWLNENATVMVVTDVSTNKVLGVEEIPADSDFHEELELHRDLTE